MVYGLRVAAISIGEYYSRRSEERAPPIGYETEGFYDMDHETGDEESECNAYGDEPSTPVR